MKVIRIVFVSNSVLRCLGKVKPDVRDTLKDLAFSSVASFIIIWCYNIYHDNEYFGITLHFILKNLELTLAFSLGILFFEHKKNFVKHYNKVLSLIIVIIVFVVLDFDNLVFHDLWNVRGYPSASIFFNFMNIQSLYPYFVNVPPIDPFQMLVLIPLSLFRSICERGLELLFKKANFKKHIINIT